MQVKMRRAVKYRMYPNKAQAQLIDRTIGCARFIYNQMLETRITTYKATGETCNPTPAQYKDRFPFLREVDRGKSVRDWVCPNCGVWHDRDANAAVNIMREAQRLSREQ